jgi:hypothetical protein
LPFKESLEIERGKVSYPLLIENIIKNLTYSNTYSPPSQGLYGRAKMHIKR